MGFTVIPTNIGGVSLNSIAGPLASLIGGTPSAQIMNFPSDLGSNPAMGHAVIFQAYDYNTKLGNALSALGSSISSSSFSGAVSTLQSAGNAGLNAINSANQAATNAGGGTSGVAAGFTSLLGEVEGALQTGPGQVAVGAITPADYTPIAKGTPLATISLFMPETMTITYEADWGSVNLGTELGIKGQLGTAWSDRSNKGLKDAAMPYAKYYGSKIAGTILGSSGAGGLIGQSLGVAAMNPQTQLLYRGQELRSFQLSFILTPKTSSEAQTIKNICDSFAYFSLPGLAGTQSGTMGQFFTPPQVFSVQFQFLGGSSIGNQISNAIISALNNTGLNVLTSATGGSNTITGGKPSKTFTVNDCVLTNVAIDYAPNGWATYNDGYPVQTTITLQFKETTVYTKNQMGGTAVAANYNNNQQNNATRQNLDYSNMSMDQLNAASDPTSSTFIGI